MHVHRAYQVSVPTKTTGFAVPLPVPRLVFMPTVGTPAAGSSFGAGEAHNMGLVTFVREIGNVPAIFPQGHALIVVPAIVLVTNPMRIADEEGADLLFDTKVDHFARGFVSQITNTAFSASALLVLRPLQLLPALRILFASGLLLCYLPSLLAPLPLERTNTTSSYHESLACVGGDGRQMDFSEIDGGMNIARGLFFLLDLNTHMQLEAVIPDD
jgi:hypothetical protein